MADAEYGAYGAYPVSRGPGTGLSAGHGRGQRIVNIAGALGSVALVLGLGWWGWELAVRDARGVPVIRAMEGAMRMAPEDPGGAVVDHQGLAVNDVPAQGGAAPPPDRLVLAPRPVDLTLEDAPGLAAAMPATGGEEVSSAPATTPSAMVPVAEGTDDDAAVAAALAEALGVDAGGVVETAALDDQGQPPPEGAITRSPRPMPRPDGGVRAALSAAPAEVAKPVRIDPATLSPGTRLVQFGAYDSDEQAEQIWTRIAGQFPALMEGKSMVIQTAESGGRTFWRLRALGFQDEGDSRRFCAALEAEGTKCIPVAHR